jgi:hypothetical protein
VAHFDPTILTIVLIVMVPVIAGFTLMARRLRLQQEQFKLLMEERKLLIENGVRDLPPVTLPTLSGPRFDGFRHLRVGVVLTLVAAVSGAYAALHGGKLYMLGSDTESLIWIVGAIGVAHLALHFIRRAYDRRAAEQCQDANRAGHDDGTGLH